MPKFSGEIDLLNAANMAYIQLREIALDNFVWTEIPEEIESRYIECALYQYGLCGIGVLPTGKYVALPVAVQGELNTYFEPERFRLIGNRVNQAIDFSKTGIVIRDHITAPEDGKGLLGFATYYAAKIAETQQSIDMQIMHHSVPWVMEVTDTKKRFTAQWFVNLWKKREPLILSNSGLNPDSIKAIATGQEYISDKIYSLKNSYINEFLRIVGYDNIAQEKGERLNIPETTIGTEITKGGYAQSMLDCRNRAGEKLRKLYPEYGWRCAFNRPEETVLSDVITSDNQPKMEDNINA